ncbi:MAG: PEGA domain-containing protein [Roseburia sp.]|nr:PEGA domain-containing protein [Roseburia sp.]
MRQDKKKDKRQMQQGLQRGNLLLMLFAGMIVMLTLASCNTLLPGEGGNDGSRKPLTEESKEQADTGYIVTGPDSYDSADTAILTEKNIQEGTLTFLNLEVGRKYTLSYDGTTGIYDKYGESMSLNQIEKGSIVDVTFLKDEKHLTTMGLSAKAWSFDAVERYEMDTIKGQITVGGETYKLSENTQFISEDKNIEIMDLNAEDIIGLEGIDTTILCVRVEKGHGYLRLVNDEHFVGGWIEIGQSKIQQITDDMLLTVAEGSYEVSITHNGNGGVKHAVINRNQETTLDIGDFEVAEPETGMVLFSINPSTAELYIDGTKMDASAPITLEYGLHQLIIRAEGYHSITRYIRVSQASVGVDIVLEEVSPDDEEEESKEEEKPDDSEPEIEIGKYLVYIDAPEKVEVYLDSNYVGISPCSFRKVSGIHAVTLRKSGYVTRSYTIQIDEEEKDVSFSFAELEPVNPDNSTTSSNNGTSSSNTGTSSSNTGTGSSNSTSSNKGTVSDNSGNILGWILKEALSSVFS